MASPSQPHVASPVNPDTLITLKIVVDGNTRRFKLALRDLGANVLPQKVRLDIVSIRFSPGRLTLFRLALMSDPLSFQVN